MYNSDFDHGTRQVKNPIAKGSRPGMQGGYQLLSQLSSGCSRACPDAV